MSSGGEMRGFVFSVVFIIVFSTLLATVPAGLQGIGDTGSSVIPVDPSIITDFIAGENYTKPAFTPLPPSSYAYAYSLAEREWTCLVSEQYDPYYIGLTAKVYYIPFLWFGHTDPCNFMTDSANRGDSLTFDEIDADADDGTARYSLQHVISGESAGGFIAHWNTTTYDNSTQAWDNEELYLLHGVGFTTSATNDIGALIVGLLFLQLPAVPVLVNVLIVIPIWACIIYVFWFIVKEMIPFL